MPIKMINQSLFTWSKKSFIKIYGIESGQDTDPARVNV